MLFNEVDLLLQLDYKGGTGVYSIKEGTLPLQFWGTFTVGTFLGAETMEFHRLLPTVGFVPFGTGGLLEAPLATRFQRFLPLLLGRGLCLEPGLAVWGR